MTATIRATVFFLLACACASGEGTHPEPKRSPEGLPITGRAPYDAYFQEVRRLDARARDLGAESDALAGPLAVALELPISAPTEDLAATLGKSVKRCVSLGITVRLVLDVASPTSKARIETSGDGAVPTSLLPGFEAAAAALSTAQALHPNLQDAVRRAEALRQEGLRLERATPADFSPRGAAYTRAVIHELADAKAQVEATRESLQQACDYVGDFLARLPSLAAAGGARVQRITPGLTSR